MLYSEGYLLSSKPDPDGASGKGDDDFTSCPGRTGARRAADSALCHRHPQKPG